MTLVVALALNPAESAVAASTSSNIGYADQYFGSNAGTNSPTADKPENKAWFAYGSWWSDLWDAGSAQHRIFRLDRSTHSWVDTGTVLDNRPATESDTLFDGTHLFVSSHVIAAANNKAVKDKPTRLYRYTWSGTAWKLDSGFPITIQPYSTESLTIDVDASGVIWATWTRGGQVWVTATTANADNATVSFLTPWVLSAPSTNTSVNADDISAVVSYDSDRMMIVWSNQNDSNLYYATHLNGTPLTSWTGGVANTGPLMADDHVNLKSLQSDPEGRVFAAVKTSRNDAADSRPTDPLIELLTFRPLSGTWSSAVFGTVADHHTRPIVLIDQEDQSVHVFATGPSTPGTVAYTGTIYEKTASLANPVFAPGVGVPVIREAGSANMNNASSTRQAVDSTTGLVVLAANSATKQYWHLEEDLSPVAAQVPTAAFTASPATGTAPLPVSFTDTSTGSPTSWAWDFGDGATSTSRSPAHTFTAAGTYTVTLTVQNAAGSSAAHRTVTVTAAAAAPNAAFTAAPAQGTAPLDVAFTDTSTGSPTSWAWDFGDGGTSTSPSPHHTYTGAGTYTVTLTATNANGSSTATRQVIATAGGGGAVLYRVNAGGGAVAGSPTWTGDTAGSPSGYSNAAAAYSVAYTTTKSISLTDASVPSGTPEALFQSHRYDVSKAQPMKWSFPVPAGSYRVRLYFAETWSTNYVAGHRVFTVQAEGADVLPGLDVWKTAGAKTGLVEQLDVPVSDGTLNLDFLPVKNNPMVSAIEVSAA